MHVVGMTAGEGKSRKVGGMWGSIGSFTLLGSAGATRQRASAGSDVARRQVVGAGAQEMARQREPIDCTAQLWEVIRPAAE